MQTAKIEKAVTSDHSSLTKITFDSKAFWGYSNEQLLKWENDLIITENYISENETYKLILNDEIIGYYSFVKLSGGHLKLDCFFIIQKFIGKGFGHALLNDFLRKAKELNIIDVILEADPNAENFYKKFGFITYDRKESSLKGRFLPQMKLEFI